MRNHFVICYGRRRADTAENKYDGTIYFLGAVYFNEPLQHMQLKIVGRTVVYVMSVHQYHTQFKIFTQTY